MRRRFTATVHILNRVIAHHRLNSSVADNSYAYVRQMVLLFKQYEMNPLSRLPCIITVQHFEDYVDCVHNIELNNKIPTM